MTLHALRRAKACGATLCVVVYCVVVYQSGASARQFPIGAATPAFAARCPTGEASWTQDERSLWERICNGQKTDLRKLKNSTSPLLRPEFLRTILRIEPYRSSVKGTISIIGAHYTKPLDLSGVSLRSELIFDESHFDGPVDLSRTDIRRFSCKQCYFNFRSTKNRPAPSFALDSARVEESLDLSQAHCIDLKADSIRIGLHALMTGAAISTISFNSAEVGGEFVFDAAELSGIMFADSTRFHGRVFLSSGRLHDIRLRNASVGSVLDLSDSIIDNFDADQSDVGKSVILTCDQGAGCSKRRHEFGKVDLTEARIGGDLDLNSAQEIQAYHVKVNGDVSLQGGQFGKAVFNGAQLGGTFRILEATVASVDLTSSRIDGDLILGRTKRPIWRGRDGLVLRNATVHAIDDSPPSCGDQCEDPWPSGCTTSSDANCTSLDLSGFSYSALGATTQLGWNGSKTASKSGASWLRRAPYSPQPYEQLASVLHSSGWPEAATGILYESKNREADSPGTSWPRVAFLDFTRILIGYGYYPIYAGGWAILLIVIGVVFLEGTGQYTRLPQQSTPRIINEFIYSFDILIPLVTLRKADEDLVELDGAAEYWFYFQKAAGYVLATFLLAGLSGLTK